MAEQKAPAPVRGQGPLLRNSSGAPVREQDSVRGRDPLLQVENINCRYGRKVIIEDFSFSVAPGQIVCLLGPSGCGKTTALRAIAGFEKIHAGRIGLEGRTLSDPGRTLSPEQRGIGMVFQDYALFPHLKVRDNVGFGLHRLPGPEREARVDSLLALVKLEDYAEAWPHQLSGGQQQRVALARALAPAPRVLLLDEPFSSLDAELRRSLSLEVRDILKSRGISAVLVTHDQNEAFNVADEIGVMDRGELQQWGRPQDLFAQPANRFVAGFICNGRFLPGRLTAPGRASTRFGEVTVQRTDGLIPDTPLDILVRPWDLRAAETGGCPAVIAGQQFLGATSSTTLELEDGVRLESNDEALAGHPVGERVRLTLDAGEGLLAFPARPGTAPG